MNAFVWYYGSVFSCREISYYVFYPIKSDVHLLNQQRRDFFFHLFVDSWSADSLWMTNTVSVFTPQYFNFRFYNIYFQKIVKIFTHSMAFIHKRLLVRFAFLVFILSTSLLWKQCPCIPSTLHVCLCITFSYMSGCMYVSLTFIWVAVWLFSKSLTFIWVTVWLFSKCLTFMSMIVFLFVNGSLIFVWVAVCLWVSILYDWLHL